MVVESSPEELPDGWIVQYNVLKTGRKIKYYLNCKTGKKSFSREDVAQQSFCTNRSDHSRATKNTVNRHLISNQMQLPNDENNSPKWLPDGWTTEVKTRSGSGKNYKCYVDPSTNCKFYSKLQVLQYLRTHKPKSGNSVRSVHPAGKKSQVMVIKPTMEELPPGWIKEVKVRRNGIRKDMYYRDPVTGHVFRSKREVQRYLETGEMSMRPKKWRKVNDIPTFAKEDVPCHSLCISIVAQPEAGKDIHNRHAESSQKTHLVNAENNGLEWLPDGWIVKTKRGSERTYKCYVDPSTNRKFFSKPKLLHYLESLKQEICTSKQGNTDTSVQTAAKSSTSKRPKLAESADQQKLSEDKLIDNATGSNKTSSASLSILPDANISGKTVGKEEIANNERALSLRSVITPDDDLLLRELKRNSKQKVQSSSRSNYKKLSALPCRSSKRLAGHDPEMAGLSLLSSRRSQKMEKSSGSDSEVDGKNTSESSESKALVKLVVEQKVELQSHARTDVVEPHEQTDPLEQLQKLETEKKIFDESKYKMNPPIEFLSDPCLAFAIRTLTGDMPVEAAVACVLPSTVATDVANEKTLTGDMPVEAAVACVLPSTPATDMANEKKVTGESIQKGSSGTSAIDTSKSISTKEVNLPRWYSRRLSRHVLQGKVYSVSKHLKFSSEAETSPSVDLGWDKMSANHCSTDVKAVHNHKPSDERKGTNNCHVVAEMQPEKTVHNHKPSDERKGTNNCHAVAEMPPEKVETPTNSRGNSIPKPVFPLADFWLDPRLEFAVKNLTGAIPVEKNLIVRDLHRELCESHAQTKTQPKATVIYPNNDGRSDLHRELCESHAQTQAKATVIYCNSDGSLAPPNLDLRKFATIGTSTCLDKSQMQYPLNGTLPLPVGDANIYSSNAFQLRKPPF